MRGTGGTHLAARPCLLHEAVQQRRGGEVGGGGLQWLCGPPREEHSVDFREERTHVTLGGVVRDRYHAGACAGPAMMFSRWTNRTQGAE
eukprot:270917-Prorocentrum_minimum.AAC.1